MIGNWILKDFGQTDFSVNFIHSICCRYHVIANPLERKMTMPKAIFMVLLVWFYTIPWALFPYFQVWGRFVPGKFREILATNVSVASIQID